MGVFGAFEGVTTVVEDFCCSGVEKNRDTVRTELVIVTSDESWEEYGDLRADLRDGVVGVFASRGIKQAREELQKLGGSRCNWQPRLSSKSVRPSG